jgi:4-hydroxy-tetrahydrodipicolinate synthase
MERLKGFVPAIVTPFDVRGEIQLADFETIVRRFVDIGADGICIAGDNGESWALSLEERRTLFRAARKITGASFPLILGASAATTKQSIKYAEAAAEERADAILLMPQTYVLKATRSELLAHFRGVAGAVDIPIVAYNSPRRSGISMSVDDIAAICDTAPIVGLKESTRDIHHLGNLIHRLGSRIAVMTGPASFIFFGAAVGAAGFIATGPELLGKTASRLMEIGRSAPNDEYRQLQHTLTVLYEALMGIGTWPAALKAALNAIGLPAGVPRDPVQPLGPSEFEKLTSLLRNFGIR